VLQYALLLGGLLAAGLAIFFAPRLLKEHRRRRMRIDRAKQNPNLKLK